MNARSTECDPPTGDRIRATRHTTRRYKQPAPGDLCCTWTSRRSAGSRPASDALTAADHGIPRIRVLTDNAKDYVISCDVAAATTTIGARHNTITQRSLCTDLTVREVLAHLTAGATLTGPRWFLGVLRCRFDFDKQVLMRLREQLGDGPADTLARFRRAVTNTVKPPLPTMAMLGETIVHGSDQVVLARGRVRVLRLTATDGPFAAGEGPAVSGPTLALIMAMTGRIRFCDDLDGPGVATLRDRCPVYA